MLELRGVTRRIGDFYLSGVDLRVEPDEYFVLMGPSVLGFFTEQTARSLEPVNIFAMGLITAVIGGHLSYRRLHNAKRRILSGYLDTPPRGIRFEFGPRGKPFVSWPDRAPASWSV